MGTCILIQNKTMQIDEPIRIETPSLRDENDLN